MLEAGVELGSSPGGDSHLDGQSLRCGVGRCAITRARQRSMNTVSRSGWGLGTGRCGYVARERWRGERDARGALRRLIRRAVRW